MLFDTSSSISGVDKEYVDDLISKIKLKQGTPGLDSRNIELRKGEGNLEWRYSTKLNNLVDFKSDFVKAIVNKEDVVKKLLIQSDTPNAEYVQIKTVTVFGIDEQGNLVASLNPSINTAPPGKKFEYFGGFDPTRGAIELSANTEIDGDMSIQNVVNNIVPAFQDETIVDISEIILNVYLLDSEMNELKRVKVNYVINKTTNNNWNTLVNLSELKGQRGEKGDKGEPGTPADLSDYYTRTETDEKISQEIANAQLGGSGEVDLSAYATKEELKGKADKTHAHSNYSETTHNHNDIYAVKSSEHNHTNKLALDKVTDTKITEWNNKANSDHTHSNYAATNHNHDSVYAKTTYVDEQIQNIETTPGAKGEQGFGWLFGENAPTNEGRNGDLYYKYNTFDVYRKTEGTWKASGNLKGTKGDTGDRGATGERGADGKNVSLQKTGTHIQWKLNDDVDTWHNLVALEDIKGAKGDKGEPGSNATVEVVDNLTSSSTTAVLSANQGKVLKEKIDEVFQSVSSGKQLIASAITDKGVETSNTDTFEQMAINISSIQSGGGSLTEAEIEEAEYWKTATDWGNRFYGDKRTEIPLLDTSHVQSAEYMFYNCRNLLKIQDLDTSNIENMAFMFSNCLNLKSIGLLDTSKVANMSNTFQYCKNLTYIRFNPNANNIKDFDISYSTQMTKEDLTGMFESLPTISTSIKIKLGSTLLNKLTEEDKLIATNKGYTLA